MKTLNIEIPEGYEIDKEKSTFETIVFKKKAETLPKTWEELITIRGYYTNYNSNIDFYSTGFVESKNRNVFATEGQAKASIALAQLSQLREVYRNGWKPDWEDDSIKACIDFAGNRIGTTRYGMSSVFLSFQSMEIAEEFLTNFKDLIKQAKPLMN
jgi:hypothetical protein